MADNRVCFDCSRPATHKVVLIGDPSYARFVCDKAVGSYAVSDLWKIHKLRKPRKETA